MVIVSSLPVELSIADTFKIPLASISNVTSIVASPRGMGGIPQRLNSPSTLLSFTMERSPSTTIILTDFWLCPVVLNGADFFVGIVVLRLTTVLITPPATLFPRERGVTSCNSSCGTLSDTTTSDNMAACTVAPYATASSAFIDLFKFFPLNNAESIV